MNNAPAPASETAAAATERVPGSAVYVAIFALIVCVVGASFAWGAVVGGRILALCLGLHAVARVILPDGVVPRVRSRRLDCAAGLAAGAMLWYLASWGATPLVY